MRVGNPQCVVLMPLPARERFLALGAALSRHEARLGRTWSSRRSCHLIVFDPDLGTRRRPMASGTGACAAAVTAAAYGGAGLTFEAAMGHPAVISSPTLSIALTAAAARRSRPLRLRVR